MGRCRSKRVGEQTAIDSLPDIDTDPPQQRRATGTDDASACTPLAQGPAVHCRTLPQSAIDTQRNASDNAVLVRTGGGAVERASLENWYTFRGIVGSNPTLSALAVASRDRAAAPVH